MLTVALVTDVHFGPAAHFGGTLRKLGERAADLLEAAVGVIACEVEPDLVVNLGDLIEDESPELDLARYRTGLGLLAKVPAPLVSLAGNHDRINLEPATLRALWGLPTEGPLFRSFDLGGCHWVMLYTQERKDVDVHVDQQQMGWLDGDLGATTLPTIVLMHHSAAEQDLRGNRWFERAPHICLIAERRELRAVLRRHAHVVAVLNGHLHWNHLFVEDRIPYLTLQSLTENIRDDEPAEPAAAYAVARIEPGWLRVEVAGAQPARYQLELRGPGRW